MARERKFSTLELLQEAKQLVLQHGHDGFHFGLLAERMEVSRSTLYKYYDNKDELITDLMLHEMELFLRELAQIEERHGFDEQFDFLIELILRNAEIHQLLGMAAQLPKQSTDKVKANREKLDSLHLDMYAMLRHFVEAGFAEGKLKPHIPAGLVLGFIFQSIAIPNHQRIPQDEWVAALKHIIRHGMFTNE